MKKKIAAIDLFCGAGGLTYGLQLAGIDVVAGIDLDPACKYPYEANNDAKFIGQDVTAIKGSDLEKLFPKGALRLIAGCAPCQPFSSHSKGRDTSEDPKWPLLDQFARIVDEVRPEFVTMENVVRIKGHAVFKRFVTKLESLDYKVVYGSLYCPKYGIPQQRRRLVLLASKLGPIELPHPTHAEDKFVSVRTAIGKLRPIAGGEIDVKDALHIAPLLSPINKKRIRSSIPGGTWLDWPASLRAECHARETGSSFQGVYARMQWDLPSPTITTQFYNFGTGRFGHPEQDRAITLREGALLQSFPRHYKFIKNGDQATKNSIGRLIGNAVPPKLGEAIGAAIVASVL